jgi:hypothetical protein
MPEFSPSWISFREFREALCSSRLRFAELKAEHPRLRGYLVISSAAGQNGGTHGFEQVLSGFSRLFRDGDAKDAALERLHKLGSIRKNPALGLIREAESALQEMTDTMQVDGRAQIEIRFEHLDYALIDALRMDPRIDRQLTPQTRASIRIVLGNVAGLAHPQDALELNSNIS